MTDTKDHDYYERNLGRHPAYSAIMDRLKAEFAELDAAEQAVRLKVDEAEETLASLRSEVPLLEQRYLDAASYQEQHKAKGEVAREPRQTVLCRTRPGRPAHRIGGRADRNRPGEETSL